MRRFCLAALSVCRRSPQIARKRRPGCRGRPRNSLESVSTCCCRSLLTAALQRSGNATREMSSPENVQKRSPDHFLFPDSLVLKRPFFQHSCPGEEQIDVAPMASDILQEKPPPRCFASLFLSSPLFCRSVRTEADGRFPFQPPTHPRRKPARPKPRRCSVNRGLYARNCIEYLSA